MAFDSVTSLLFNIGANSDDAEENIARFRALLGTDLEAIGGQFAKWSEETFGKIETVKGAMLGLTAGLAAIGVGAIAMANEAIDHFDEFAIAVDNAAKKTGISVGEMSKLHFAADEIGVSFDSLVTGLVRLSRSMMAAAEGGTMQQSAFQKLGLTQKDLTDGQTSMLPLIEKIADRYTHMADGAGKAAISQELFSRGGSELIRFLNMGSAGIQELSKHAEELGLVLTDKDVLAARELQAGIKAMHAEQEAVDKYIAETTLPLWNKWHAIEVGFLKTLQDFAQGKIVKDFFTTMLLDTAEAAVAIQKVTELSAKAGGEDHPIFAPVKKAKEAASDVHSLTTELDNMKLRLAELDGPEAKLAAELEQMRDRTAAAATELIKLHDAGKLAPGVWEREAHALLELRAAMGQWGEEERRQLADKDLAELQKFVDKANTVAAQIQEKINAQNTDEGWDRKRDKWDAEIQAMRERYKQEGTLSAENQQLLAVLAAAGEARIDEEQDSAWANQMVKVKEHQDRLATMEMTRYQRLAAEYQKDVERFSEAEEAKALMNARTDQERQATEQQFAGIRTALMLNYQRDLQALENSEGWQGVFGNHFAALIKGNEQLQKDWAVSSDQSLMLVKVAVQSMGDMGKHAFDQMAQGMGGGIANALVYSKSIGEAMRAATASTLESIAAQAMTEAIYSLAWGFQDLAKGDTVGADAAFEAAALFGAVGLAAGVAGRAVAPSSAGGGSGGRGGGSSGGTGAPGRIGGGSGGGPTASATAGGVSVHVYGHVVGASGIEQLASMINDAVQNRDVRLVATQVRQTTPATF